LQQSHLSPNLTTHFPKIRLTVKPSSHILGPFATGFTIKILYSFLTTSIQYSTLFYQRSITPQSWREWTFLYWTVIQFIAALANSIKSITFIKFLHKVNWIGKHLHGDWWHILVKRTNTETIAWLQTPAKCIFRQAPSQAPQQNGVNFLLPQSSPSELNFNFIRIAQTAHSHIQAWHLCQKYLNNWHLTPDFHSVRVQTVVVWVWHRVGGYQRFGGTYFLTSTLKMGAVCLSETLISNYKIAWCHNPDDHSRVRDERKDCAWLYDVEENWLSTYQLKTEICSHQCRGCLYPENSHYNITEPTVRTGPSTLPTALEEADVTRKGNSVTLGGVASKTVTSFANTTIRTQIRLLQVLNRLRINAFVVGVSRLENTVPTRVAITGCRLGTERQMSVK
jgi:hypothetical protein